MPLSNNADAKGFDTTLNIKLPYITIISQNIYDIQEGRL